MNIHADVSVTPDGNLSVTVTRTVSQAYVWSFALLAVVFAAMFGIGFVQAGAYPEAAIVFTLLASPFVGLAVFGAIVHARPFVEEITVRDGVLTLRRHRYRTRTAFVGSATEGVEAEVWNPTGVNGEAGLALLLSVPGRAASAGVGLPRADLEAIRSLLHPTLQEAAPHI